MNSLHNVKLIRKTVILVSFLILIMGIVFICFMDNRKKSIYPGVTYENYFNILVPADENEGIYSDIYGYFENDVINIFLPTRADATSLVYYAIDAEGNYLERYENDFSKLPGSVLSVPVVVYSSDLPSVEITTNDAYGTMEAVLNDPLHNTEAFGHMVVSVKDDFAPIYGGETIFDSRDYAFDYNKKESMSISGRGNLTWTERKRPYEIKIEADKSILGMAPGKKWELLANVVDHACLRNEVLLNLAKDCGVKYVSDIQPVDLFINGVYQGNYSMCTKVEISPYRVDIDPDKDYFYRWGLLKGEYRYVESSSMWNEDNIVQLLNPKYTESDNKAFEIFQQMITAIEDTDSDEYLKYVDLESFARYYWVQEISKNTDAAFRSVYSYWDHETQKMYLISSWDFDRTIGTIEQWNKDLDYDYPTGYIIRQDEWYEPLFAHPEFVEEVNRVYWDGISQALEKSVSEIPVRINRVLQSATMNFMVWDYLEAPLDGYYNKIEYYMGDRSYESETTWLYEWMRQRKEWLDEENSK